MDISKESFKLICLSNGRVLFVDKDSILEDTNEYLTLDSAKTYDISIQPVGPNKIEYIIQKVSDNILHSIAMQIYKINIINYLKIDKDNVIYKTVVKKRSNILIPGQG